jgi:hypothetical protein
MEPAVIREGVSALRATAGADVVALAGGIVVYHVMSRFANGTLMFHQPHVTFT